MSYSRPRVSNNNPYSESLFRTQILPDVAHQGLCIAGAVREWMLAFEQAYNEQHLHSGIQYVTPTDRHRGVDQKCLERRKAVYESAKHRYPKHKSGSIRNWEVTGSVSLTQGKCTKSSVISRLLKSSYLDNWVENHR